MNRCTSKYGHDVRGYWHWPSGWSAISRPFGVEHYHALVCRICGHSLPLGPARDTAETEVEVRAAALAQATREEREGRADETWTDDENDGWNYHRQGWTPPADYEAGWLAREIWEDQ